MITAPARINRVEIDLLREGRRQFEFPQRYLSPEQEKPYYIVVHRSHRPAEAELYALDLRDRLPPIQNPLTARRAGRSVDLQPLLARVYRNGRFPIDYDAPCDPPLADSDAAWAKQMLLSKTKPA